MNGEQTPNTIELPENFKEFMWDMLPAVSQQIHQMRLAGELEHVVRELEYIRMELQKQTRLKAVELSIQTGARGLITKETYEYMVKLANAEVTEGAKWSDE